VRVGLVTLFVSGAGLRFLRAALALPGTRVALVSDEPLSRCPPDVQQALAGHWEVEDLLDAGALAAAARGIAAQLGGLDRFFAVQEHAQLPVAEARAVVGVPGMDPDTVRNFRDKARMKSVLQAAGVPCARHRLAPDAAAARAFAAEIGFPLVAKPPAGAGAAGTHSLADAGQLEELLAHAPPRPQDPLLLEEFVRGEEHSFDCVWTDGQPRWHSVSVYRPSCLDVLKNDWIQWTVLLPRRIDGPEHDPIRAAGEAALRALGFTTGLSHMEWFRRPDGSVAISEAGARPPGAQFTTLMGLAHDADFYRAWTRLMVQGEFDPPARRYAAGGAYLRAQGQGRVRGVTGRDEVERRFGPLIAEASWPEPGVDTEEGYEGQGFVLLRHPDTEAVASALDEIVRLVRVELA